MIVVIHLFFKASNIKWRTSVLSAYNYRKTFQRKHLHTFPLWCSWKFNRISREEEPVCYHLICFPPVAISHKADLWKSRSRRLIACIPWVKKHISYNCKWLQYYFIVLLKICLQSDNLDHNFSSWWHLWHSGAIMVWEPEMIN